MNTIRNRHLIKVCQKLLRFHAGSRSVMRSPSLVCSKKSKSDTNVEGEPIKFTKSKAFYHEPINELEVRSTKNRPGIEILSLYLSFVVLCVYLYYREENDLDESMSNLKL